MAVIPYTIFSWAGVIALGALVYRHSMSRKTAKRIPIKAPTSHTPAARKGPKAKSKNARKKKPKAGQVPAPVKSTKELPAAAPSYERIDPSSEDEGVNDKEFARQMTLAQKGTKLVAKKGDDNCIRSVKQTRAEEKPVVTDVARKASIPSSTALIYTNEDQSAKPSLVVDVVKSALVVQAIEPAPVVQVVELTKTPEPTLITKQRQRRRKAEQKKASRTDGEKESVKLLEAQFPLDRILEVCGAPNDTSLVVSASKTEEWISPLPSEEQQLERAIQAPLPKEWNTVHSKASKHDKKTVDSATQDTECDTNASLVLVGERRPAPKLRRPTRRVKDELVEVEWDV